VIVQETALVGWDSYYVIVGSSAAALTGLMFVVITLVAGSRQQSTQGVAAFGTPTIVHFCTALLISAILSAPWHSLTSVGLTIGLVGAAGLVYLAIVTRRAHQQTVYQPVMEDWIFHTILPCLVYITFFIAAWILVWHPAPALFAIAAVTLLLVFVGIHNAWDTITWLALEELRRSDQAAKEQSPT
jgi:F0F1-type ATP synthase assembly protein I